MELPDYLKTKSRPELEEWFLEGLSKDPVPADDMLALLTVLAASGEREAAAEWAELLQDAVARQAGAEAAMRLLELRLAWQDGDPTFRNVCRSACQALFPGRLGTAWVESAGFGDPAIELAECLHRVRLLSSLAPGIMCHDRTWGFGVVQRVDDFYRKITIDFDKRIGHEMTFAYAGETLERVDDGHLMARRRRDPDGLAGLVRDDAAAVVKLALASYGAMSAPRLQEILVPALVAEDDWKRFWDAARKALKADPLVEVPARRNEPIRLLAAEKEYGAAWFAALREERDVQTLIDRLTEWEEQVGPAALTPEQRAIVSERIGFAIRGSQWGNPERVARFLMLASRLGFTRLPEGAGAGVAWRLDTGELADALLDPNRCVATLAALPARDVDPFLEYLSTRAPQRAGDVLLTVVNRLPIGVLKAALARLQKLARGEDTVARLRGLFIGQEASPALVLWVCLNLDEAAAGSAISMPELLMKCVEVLGSDCSGDDLKARNQLETLFAKPAWLKTILDRVEASVRRDMLKRLQGMRGLEASQQRSIMARVIKLYPELEDGVGAEAEPAREGNRPRYTSWRSYGRRRELLRKLVEELIPANSREIAVARSYGDLSENHEYKAAKEHQGILLKRRGEMEQGLKEVQGTDFEGFKTDRAGMGTTVQVQRPGGELLRYCILGEWDGDETLGIISSQSQLARLLDGLRTGDEVRLPAAGGAPDGGEATETCRIVAIAAPDERVREWIRTPAPVDS